MHAQAGCRAGTLAHARAHEVDHTLARARARAHRGGAGPISRVTTTGGQTAPAVTILVAEEAIHVKANEFSSSVLQALQQLTIHFSL